MKELKKCQCGCGVAIAEVHPKRVYTKLGVIKGEIHVSNYKQRVANGAAPPLKTIVCEYCYEETPALFGCAKYCDADMTGRECASLARSSAREKLYAEERARKRAAVGVGALHGLGRRWRNPRFDRIVVCLTPSPCRRYASCSDRSELGQKWEYEITGKGCWEAPLK